MVRSADAVTANYVQSRKGVIPRVFVWIEAKNRTTGGLETMGFWNGIDTEDVTVVSANTGLPVTRTYHAWGSLLDVPAIPRKIGLEVRTVRLKLSGISAQVMQAFRGYDPRGGICEIHRGLLDLDSHLLIANPLPLFLGWVNGAPIETPPVGSEGGVELAVVSHTRMLTRTNPAKRSDESQKLRQGDRLRRYSGVAGEIEFFWMEKTGKIAAAPENVAISQRWMGR